MDDGEREGGGEGGREWDRGRSEREVIPFYLLSLGEIKLFIV